MVTVHRKIVWQLQIACLDIFWIFIWLMREAQSFGYCASYNYFASAHLPIICLLQIDTFFHHWKLSKYLITVHRKIVWQIQVAYLDIFRRFIWLLRKPIFRLLRIYHFATAHLSFCCCASPNFLSTANRPIISPVEIA